MQKFVHVSDRTLRLLVGILLLGVAGGTYTEFLSVTQSLLLTVALVGAVTVSGIRVFAHTSR